MVVLGQIFKFFSFFLFLSALNAKELPTDIQQKITPYLIPESHPLKKQLDHLFKDSKVLFDLKTLTAAGFENPHPRKYTHLIVTKHPACPGIIFKLYTHTQRYFSHQLEHEHWIARIKGAKKIENLIKASDFSEQFKVPKKWIYLLPNPLLYDRYYEKNSLLVEEDMDLLNSKENHAYWKNEITIERLSQLYTIVQKLGLKDCLKPDNVPCAKDGKLSFVDTESHGCKKIPYEKLLPFLSKRNQIFWKNTIKNESY